MANILDQLFKFAPVEDASIVEDTSSSGEVAHTTTSGVESTQAQAQPMQAEQGQAGPEDATGENISMEDLATAIKDALADRDEQIANLQKQVQQLTRYGVASSNDQNASTQQTLSTDAPKDYVPLREMDFNLNSKEWEK